MPFSITAASDQSRVSNQMSMEPCMSSVSLVMDKGKYFNFNWPGLAKTESNEGLCVFLNMPGLKKEDVKASVDNNMSINGLKDDKMYYAFMKLPVDKTRWMIDHTDMEDGRFKVTLLKVEDKENEVKKTNIITTWMFEPLGCFILSSVIMGFAQSYIVEELGPWWFDSFTVCKKETAKSLHISIMPGIEKTEELPSEGLCVSLNMPELKIEDVRFFFKSDILFIEGKPKTSKVHYITGIRLPEFYERKRSMIKTEMQDGMFKITLPKTKDKTSVLSNILVDFISKRPCSHGSNGWASRIVTRLTRLVFKWAGPKGRLTKNSCDELEIEFPVCGVDSEANIHMLVDVKNRFILTVKNNNNEIYYEHYHELPQCGNFEKAVFKTKLSAGLVTVNVTNFQKGVTWIRFR